MLSADLVRVAFVEMTGTPPTVPASPIFTVARITGEGVAFAPSVTTSNEFDPSGNIRDSILTGGESTGDLSLEVSDHDAFEAYLSAVLGGDWVSDELENGSKLRQYLFEKMFPDIPTAGADSFHRFDKTAFVTMTVSIAPGSPITGSVGTMGGVQSLDDAIIAGATYPDPGTEPVLVPQDVVVSVGGIAATACFSAVELSFDSSSRAIQCIGTLGTKETVRGRLNAQIRATLYYASDAPVQALIDQSEFPVSVQLNDASGALEYLFEFPRCKMMTAPVTASGTNTDVTIALQAQALYDATAGYTVKVTRGA
jgi:Phage tail tube protein